MNTALYNLSDNQWGRHQIGGMLNDESAQLVICFGAKHILATSGIYETIKEKFPSAQIAMCSTAGEIFHNTVMDDTLVALAIQFNSTKIETVSVSLADYNNSNEVAKALVKKLSHKDLNYILVLSDGSKIDGSSLVKGLDEATQGKVLITGGLAGDSIHFESTLVGLNEQPSEGKVVAIGFYGKNLYVTHGTQGGWEVFGHEKIVTRSAGNILFEIDHQNVLDIYKNYLGAEVNNLPSSALFFPLSVSIPGYKQSMVRTILSIDEEAKSMTFAGAIPEGAKVQFMKANLDQLTSAASNAALHALINETDVANFAILISCVGRKLVLGQRVDEEVEAVNELLGDKTVLAGFYSYGEISPFNEDKVCQLHNQTMTITTFYEL